MRRVLLWGTVVGVAVFGLPPGTPAPAEVPAGFENHFVGVMHTHTGYSDGTPGTTPADVYAAAKQHGLDFAAPAEHSEAYPVPMTLSEACLPTAGGTLVECAFADEPQESPDKWDAQRRQAVESTVPGSFLGMRGFELTDDVHGHISVYFSRNYTTRVGNEAALETFYEWLRTPAYLGGGSDGLATFNHPNDKGVDGDPRRNWNDFAYVPDLDDRFFGIEIFNRNRTRYEPWVEHALNQGWHLGMIGSEDHHGTSWGAPDLPRTVVISDGLDMSSMKDAMAARRTYAVAHPDLRIDFRGNGQQQGSIVTTEAATVTLEATVVGVDGAAVELLTNGEATPTGPGSWEASAGEQERWFMLKVTDGDKPIGYSSPIWVGAGTPEPPTPFQPRWVAGDLHVHTTWSHDAWGGPNDRTTSESNFYTWGWSPGDQISLSEARGLDFLVLTDHNNTFSVHDPGYSSNRLVLVPGYEASYRGHIQIIGGTGRCYDTQGSTDAISNCHQLVNGSSEADMRAVADAIRADGGLFQVNHPSDGNLDGGNWFGLFGDGSAPDPIVPDSIEVWNIGAWNWQPPMPASNDNDWSLRFWETYLDAGHRVAATGGSDNHWRSVTAVAGVGQPTTWVYVTQPGIAGIVEGVKAGRTTISHQPPALGGPRLFLEHGEDGMIGDTVPAGTAVTIRAENALPGAVLWVVTNLGTTEVLLGPNGTHETTVPEGTRWLRAELRRPDGQPERTALCDPLVGSDTTYCRNPLLMEAMTSPVYVD